jgi:glucosamine-6-phosphate deaminase
VPGPTKALAVARALSGCVRPELPASILRIHPRATLYLDQESAAGLEG